VVGQSLCRNEPDSTPEFHKGKSGLVSAGHSIKIATKTEANNQIAAAPCLQARQQGGQSMNTTHALLSCLPLLLSAACAHAQTRLATETVGADRSKRGGRGSKREFAIGSTARTSRHATSETSGELS